MERWLPVMQKLSMVFLGLCVIIVTITWMGEEKAPETRPPGTSGIPDELAYVYPAVGEVRRTLTVVSSPTCLDCIKLHRVVGDLNKRGVKVSYLAIPLEGLDSPVARHLETAWCAEDRNAALDGLFGMTLAQLERFPETRHSENCEAPVALHYVLARKNNLWATPAIISDDGRVVFGFKELDTLIEELNL